MATGRITGLVLAGGRGSRMGHVDKGLQLLNGEALAAHVLRRLAPQVDTIAINANRNLEAYAAFAASCNAPVWPDQRPDYPGPLAGLESGLQRCSTELLLSAPCDCPFLPLDLGARLLAALDAAQADLAVAQTLEDEQVQAQPVFALVRRTALAQLSAYLDGGGRRMDGWYAHLTVATVRFDGPAAFRNINTLPELQQYQT